MNTDKLILGILNGKEERAKKQEYLLSNHEKTLICFTLNIPGIQKRGLKYKKLFDIGILQIKYQLNLKDIKVSYSELNESPAGYEFFCMVDFEPQSVKLLMASIESASKVGRLFDIDVFSSNGELLSRTSFNLPTRKCLLCENKAAICSRNKTHNIEELLEAISKLIDNFLIESDKFEKISQKLGEFTMQAMMYEVGCYPSFGLVSPVSQGSHSDMDFYTFIDSMAVLNKYMIEFSMVGFCCDNLDDIFSNIRKIGIRAEADMFKKTGNINTHKGMIFLLGIVLSNITYAIKNKSNFAKIQENIKSMCKGITNELLLAEHKKEDELTHGEILYVKYGFLGIRGEVELGIPLAFDIGLLVYENTSDLTKNDRLVHTLLSIMAQCDDSTIIHRKNIISLNFVKNLSKDLLEKGGLYNSNVKNKLNSINEYFIKANISPGGSADILAITVLLHLVKGEFF